MVIEAAIASAGTRISPVAIVTDGASSMLNAASDAGFGSPGKPAVRCLMHLINNAVALLLGKELMSAVSHAVTRGRRRFPDWAANMRAAGETPPGQPQRMVKTRPLSIAPSVRWVLAVAEAHGRQHLDAEDIARLTEFAPALDALHDIVRHVESDSASYGWHCVLPALLRAHPSTWHRELVNAYNATTTKRITCPTTVISERVTKILRDKLEMELGVGDDRPPTGLCLTAALTRRLRYTVPLAHGTAVARSAGLLAQPRGVVPVRRRCLRRRRGFLRLGQAPAARAPFGYRRNKDGGVRGVSGSWTRPGDSGGMVEGRWNGSHHPAYVRRRGEVVVTCWPPLSLDRPDEPADGGDADIRVQTRTRRHRQSDRVGFGSRPGAFATAWRAEEAAAPKPFLFLRMLRYTTVTASLRCRTTLRLPSAPLFQRVRRWASGARWFGCHTGPNARLLRV